MTAWQVLSVRPQGPEPTPLPRFVAPTVLVFPADAMGEALAGATAAANCALVLGRITALSVENGDLAATRSSHGGRVAITVRAAPGLAIATANVLPVCDGEIVLGAPSATAIEQSPILGQRVTLEDAPIVLGGGRGLDETSFEWLDRVAESVGGAVGASLPAVDLGLAPVARQVGQSGKFVTPSIYLAIGLSGTPQHLAGIGAATRLLAINNDPDAAIFRFAEAGVVADAKALLPILSDILEHELDRTA